MPLAPPTEVFAFLKTIHDEFQPLSVKITFDKANPRHRNAMALYGSIIELTGSIIILLDRGMASGVPILLRAILEAFVDLVNLTRTAQYGYYLEVSYIKEWLKILDEAKLGKNEYLASITALLTLDETIAKWRKEKAKLEAKGFHALKIEQKFKQADMEKEYRSIYNILCSDSHNNLRSLIDRHIQREETDFEIVFYKAYTSEDSAHFVGTNAELLLRATQVVHDFFDSSAKGEIPEYRTEMDRLRGEEVAQQVAPFGAKGVSFEFPGASE